ncbi:MAG TPA: hypothetical protein ENO29_06215 [Candidatus Aminicenantes bacterium]|nr:MAG: hypothetical protein C0168_11210 [Candidatus Aminicenantes bacterium]HEK85930.1 hypothetical protein [Candidatus Aminicenantes bacterium]
MKTVLKKLKNDEILEFCSHLSQPPALKNKIQLYFNQSHSSPFPHLLGFEGLSNFEVYAEKVTLSSDDQSYLLRILKDNLKGEFEAHLLHQQKEKYQYVFICFDNQPQNYLTDSHGRAQLGQIALDLSRIKASLCPPSAIFELSKISTLVSPGWSNDRLASSKIQAEFFPGEKGQILKIRVANLPEEAEIRRMVLIIDEVETLVAIPQKGLAIFELPDNFGDLQINLYE